jgi:hypothetical protein
MPMIQDMWKKLSANERLASWGAIVVIVGWLLGLVLGTYGFGILGAIGGILLLGLYYLKYGSAQPRALPAPTETIALVISAITGLYALAALGPSGFLLGGYFVAVVVTVIGSAMMVLGTWRDYRAMAAKPMPTTIDVRRSITWGVTAIGCLTLPALTFGGLIGWADMSLPNGDSQGATLAGIVTVVALVLGLYLLIRVIRGARGVFRPDSRRRGP